MHEIKEKFGAGFTYLLQKESISQALIGKKCHMSTTSVSDYKTGKKNGSEDKRRLIAQHLGYDYDFVLALGESILSGVPGDDAFARIAENENTPAFIPVNKAQIRLSAGSGNLVFEDGFRGTYHFRTDWLHSKCSPSAAVLFEVNGDSMEPTISDGGVVLVDRGDTEFRDGKIFAIRVGDYVRIKRLYLNMDQRIRIVSDNTDKNRFPDEYCDAADLHIIGRVFWYAKEL